MTPLVLLRRPVHGDAPFLFDIGLDEVANELAGTKPRTWPEFDARWRDIVMDEDGSRTRVTPRIILADGVRVGSINVFPDDGHDAIGSWLAREHLGARHRHRARLDQPALRRKAGGLVEQTPDARRCARRGLEL